VLHRARRGAVAGRQEEVAVLLAAQRLRAHREAERSRHPFGFIDRHQRHGERAVTEEIDPGRVRG